MRKKLQVEKSGMLPISSNRFDTQSEQEWRVNARNKPLSVPCHWQVATLNCRIKDPRLTRTSRYSSQVLFRLSPPRKMFPSVIPETSSEESSFTGAVYFFYLYHSSRNKDLHPLGYIEEGGLSSLIRA
jgi:hypothetical protein